MGVKKLNPGDIDCRNCAHFKRPPDGARVVIFDKPSRSGDWWPIAEGLAPTASFKRLRYCEVYEVLDGDLMDHAGSLAEMAKACKKFEFAPGKGPEAAKEDQT